QRNGSSRQPIHQFIQVFGAADQVQIWVIHQDLRAWKPVGYFPDDAIAFPRMSRENVHQPRSSSLRASSALRKPAFTPLIRSTNSVSAFSTSESRACCSRRPHHAFTNSRRAFTSNRRFAVTSARCRKLH